MKRYKVLADSISTQSGRTFRKDAIVDANRFTDESLKALLKSKAIEEHVEPATEVATTEATTAEVKDK